jgi:DNA-binding SARP family transcriptional activator
MVADRELHARQRESRPPLRGHLAATWLAAWLTTAQNRSRKRPHTPGWHDQMIRLRLFGPLELIDAQGAEMRAVLAQPKRLSLLAYLAAASPRGFHRRDTLLALLWPELDDAHARKALNQALGFLRQELESDGDVVLSRGTQALGINVDRCWCDVAAFEDAVKAGRLGEALELYRGDLLSGWHVDEAPDFEDWSDRERFRLRALAAETAQSLAMERRRAGDLGAAIRAARQAVALSRSDERALRLLVELLDGAGDRAGALAAYAEFEKQLSADLGVEPAPETRALLDKIRARVALVPWTVPDALHDAARSATVLGVTNRESDAVVTPKSRSNRRAVRWLVGAVASALIVFMMRGGDSRDSQAKTPQDVLDPNLMAVLPFRVSDSDTSFAYLREGMVDLLSAKLGGVVRAVDPRVMVAAWQRAGANRLDADTQHVTALARHLHAGLILRGAVTGAGGTIVLSASLTELRDGSTHLASVEVRRDSLLRGIDSLVTQLLAVHAGEDLRHVVSLERVTVPMLREYLAGKALQRQGRNAEAIPHYLAAIGPDSDFALAGMGLADASLYTFGNQVLTGWRIAMRGRDRLSDRDRAIQDAIIGPAFPARPSQSEFRRLAEHATLVAPESIDAWLARADNLDEGAVQDVPDWPRRAIAAYTQALTLDSTSIHANGYLGELYLRVGDTARARTTMERALRLDSTSIGGSYSLWEAGVAFGQKDRRARGLEGLGRSGAASVINGMIFFGFATGLGFEDQEAPLLRQLEQGDGRSRPGSAVRLLYETATLRGQPTHAKQFADTLSADPQLILSVLLSAIADDGDSAWAAHFRDRFRPANMETRIAKCGPVPMLAAVYDADVRHDSTLAAHIARVIEERDRSTMDGATLRRCAIGGLSLRVLLAAPHADGELRRRAESLDSLLRLGPMDIGDFLLNMGNLVLAGAWEQLHEPRRALAAVRRRSTIYDPAQGFARMLRDEARLAAATGDVDGAIRAYRIFIALRRDAEPRLQPQVEIARQELTRLIAKRAKHGS